MSQRRRRMRAVRRRRNRRPKQFSGSPSLGGPAADGLSIAGQGAAPGLRAAR